MSWNEAFEPAYRANVLQPNLLILSPGKIPPLGPAAKISVTGQRHCCEKAHGRASGKSVNDPSSY
ncbi:hypothetical protein CYLTODRAFT_456482 [Cylindrobasidium torrendii FP15055 ss-10]|uniref:Uncharacterized protein n=1 Tax=Cylindrobasidium torrendii FP15055 ss-10 TaxID=1314674 RepID=A0A0D7B437_9AGAR|nr:hypothetical protein CYLTODRAFT_456482 [Cylindrobasidium torrendii FP15055 ss-10]